ncbi:phospholipid scramblase 2-like [Glandiceps talaboti]
MADNERKAPPEQQQLYPMHQMQPGTQGPPGQYAAVQAHPGMQPPPVTQYDVQPQIQYAPPGQPAQPPMMAQPGVPGAQQPQAAQWMPMPQAPVGCPPGLEYLTQIDQLLIHQKVEMAEVFTALQFLNRFVIKNSMGQQIYYAEEESDECHRQCCGPQRGFIMHVTDNMQQEVIRVVREFKCCAGFKCCAFSDCCAMEVAVEAPVGTIVGYFRQTVSLCAPLYELLDADRNCVLKINGPCCICQNVCCTDDVEFEIHSQEDVIGKISKQWGGIFKEAYTTATNFSLAFPLDLDVKLKALLIGGVFLIDFMYFEQKANQGNQGGRRRRR